MANNMESENVQQPALAKHDSSVLDLAFAMDCTGSMSSYIKTGQDNIRNIVEQIVASEKSDIHLALVEYRDHPPEDSTFVTRTHDFTSSVKAMKGWLDACSAQGGGDTPEAVADALHDVLKLSWRPEATKICVFISDAPPHGLGARCGDHFADGCPNNLDPMTIVRSMAEKGITLYTVGCEPSITPYKEFFAALAYLTGGQYVPLAGAKALTQVIIGGAQEEISLERWMEEVNQQVIAEMNEKGEANVTEDELCSRVHSHLQSKGAKSKQLHRNMGKLQEASKFAKEVSAYSNMSDVRSAYGKTLAAAPVPTHPPSRSRGMFSRSSAPPPAAMAMAMAPSAMDGISASEDCYNVAEDEVQMEQARRMVQKSKMRNNFNFK
ncbi:hypothetical protein SNE40_015339 [Patella caerulea]|uniref:VWFA domain-containing protein n=1 Tax=Patella caerulea TaxID=87958 RepID=A0AAN8JM07_PATCE